MGGQLDGVLDNASAVMSIAGRRLDAAAENIANLSTAGYKRKITTQGFAAQSSAAGRIELTSGRDFSSGALTPTGSKFDLAVTGEAYLLVRAGNDYMLSRDGRFNLDAEGRLVTAAGYVLQESPGIDLRLNSSQFEILADGVILEYGVPALKVGLFAARDASKMAGAVGSTFAVTESEIVEAPAGELRQGVIENSNVALADEMLTVMAAIRSAETGARLVQAYDSLIGQTLTSFGERRS